MWGLRKLGVDLEGLKLQMDLEPRGSGFRVYMTAPCTGEGSRVYGQGLVARKKAAEVRENRMQPVNWSFA